MRAPKAATLASASRARSRIACPRFHMFIDIGARVILVNTKRLAREEGRHTDKRETTLQCGIFEHRTTSPCAKRYTDRIRTSTSTHKHAADARTQRLVGIHSTSAARTNWLRALVDIPHTHCMRRHTPHTACTAAVGQHPCPGAAKHHTQRHGRRDLPRLRT